MVVARQTEAMCKTRKLRASEELGLTRSSNMKISKRWD